MSITSGFFNAELVAGIYDREYNADEFTKCFQGFISDGIVGKTKNSSTSFKVVKGSSGTSKVLVKPGYAWINGKWVQSDSDIEFTISLPTSSGNGRVDLICLRCDYDQRNFSVIKKEGEEYESILPIIPPSKIPQCQDDSHAKEIPLAHIRVTDSAEDIDDVVLVDSREMAEVKINTSNMNGLIFIKCTQEEYDEMEEHDPNTIYFVI